MIKKSAQKNECILFSERIQDIYIGIIVAMFVIFALCSRFVARRMDNDYIDKFLNFVRTFIYIGLVITWLFSVKKRVMQVQTRRTLSAVAFLMLFWIIIREFKWRFVFSADILRYLWYAYYIPMLFIPLLALLIAMSLGKSEDYHLPKQTLFLYAATTLLATAVLTNDLHQCIFAFSDSTAVWTEHECQYKAGYFLIIFWILVCSAAAILTMIKKSRIPRSGRFLWAPFIPFGISVTYTVLYLSEIYLIRLIFGDFAIFQCLSFIGVFECCIRCGLIQSNTRYFDLFSASADICVQIVDDNYNVYYAANSSKPLPPELMKQAEAEPIVSDGGRRIYNMPVDGGHAIWTEDMSELLALREALQDRQEELQERNALLQYEYEREKEHKTVEEQNRLYDLLQRKTQTQLDKIDSLVQEYKRADSYKEKKRILSCIVILGSYIKRRKDFVLSVDSTPFISESKLINAFGESFRAMSLLGIKGAYFVKTNKSCILGKTLTMAYDFFEDVLETLLDKVHFFNVSVCNINDVLRIRILADCPADTESLYRKYPCMKIISEYDDGIAFVLPLQGGDGQ